MINIKDVWSVWRKSATTDKDMQRSFKRACTPKACHDVLIELETANQKIENIQIEIQEKHCKLHAALKLRDTANERITELEALCKECADYLDTNKFTSIHNDSYLHRDLRSKALKEQAN